MQISEVSVKVCFVGPPRQPVYAGCGIAFEREKRLPERSMLRWWRSAVNLSFFLSLAACRTRSSACDTRTRPCVRCVLCSPAFLSVPALGSTGSAAGCPLCSSASQLLWRSLTSHDRASSATAPRLPDADQCSTTQLTRCWSTVRSPGSRTRSVRTCQVLRPRRAGRALALACPCRFAFRCSNVVGTRDDSFSRLNSLAYALPCQRFADALADACA